MKIIVALLLFSVLILFHELGHFTAARAVGVRVLEFAVGMGPKLCSIRHKGTVYSIRILPIGGFCSMLGEDEEGTEGIEGSFQSKTAWQRFFVIAMGPVFNFILAFFLGLFVIGYAGVDRPVMTGITPGLPAEEAGLEAGDRITALNGKHVTFMRDLTQYIYLNPGRSFRLTVVRDEAADSGVPQGSSASEESIASESGWSAGQEFTVTLTPRYDEAEGRYLIGIQYSAAGTPAGGILPLIYYAAEEVRFNITSTIAALSMLLRGALTADDLTGPVGIVDAIGDTVDETAQYGFFIVLLNLADMALLISANLGVMNLLPLPALDGGRLVFCLIEILFRRPVNRNVEGYIHFAGFVLLMILMIFVMFHDIGRIAGI